MLEFLASLAQRSHHAPATAIPMPLYPHGMQRHPVGKQAARDARRGKSAKIGQRQIDLAKRWNTDGLLSDEGLRAVLEEGKR
ncbi:hypothetical protein N8640_02885 [Akkermansiaceae bacterium]|nr:hypothetical protein [Akkermansiaceae bacterium]